MRAIGVLIERLYDPGFVGEQLGLLDGLLCSNLVVDIVALDLDNGLVSTLMRAT